MPVPVPPLVEQREIVRRTDELLAFAATVERRVAAAAERIERARRTVIAQGLRGELVPTEAELAREDGGGEGGGFETAAELLGRIGAERLAAAGGMESVELGPEVNERILAALRQACWGAGEMTADELIRKVAVRLGSPRFGKTFRGRLEAHVKVAVKRRIVAAKGELLTGATPTFGRYDFRFLLDTVRQLVRRGDEFERDEIVRAVAAHLGYGQVTPAIRERMDRVFLWAAQEGALEIRGGRIVVF
jgi:hypothetical protein